MIPFDPILPSPRPLDPLTPALKPSVVPPDAIDPPPAPPDDPSDDEFDDETERDAERDERFAEADAAGHRDRLWLRVILPLLQSRSHESDPSSRVQLAYDLMHVALCERVARIVGGDVDGGERDG